MVTYCYYNTTSNPEQRPGQKKKAASASRRKPKRPSSTRVRPTVASQSFCRAFFKKRGAPPRGWHPVFHSGNRSDYPQTVCDPPARVKVFARPFSKGRRPGGNSPFSTEEKVATPHCPYSYYRGVVKFLPSFFQKAGVFHLPERMRRRGMSMPTSQARGMVR